METEAQKKYRKSDKGKAAQAKYRASKKGQAMLKRYRDSKKTTIKKTSKKRDWPAYWKCPKCNELNGTKKKVGATVDSKCQHCKQRSKVKVE